MTYSRPMEYDRGYVAGYRDVAGGATSSQAMAVTREQLQAEEHGRGLSAEALSAYWLGYYHGRAAARRTN